MIKTSRRIAEFWCRMMHPSPLWPSHGHYRCRTCWREYPVAGRSADIALTARDCEVARGLVKPNGSRDRSLRSAGTSLVTASRSRLPRTRGLEIMLCGFRAGSLH